MPLMNRRRFLAHSLLLSGALATTSFPVHAQDLPEKEVSMLPMERLSDGAQPFTETLADMVLRDRIEDEEIAKGLRPPRPTNMAVENVLEEKWEEEMERMLRGRGARSAPRAFPAPPYRGRIDAAGRLFGGAAASVPGVPGVPGLRGPQTGGTNFASIDFNGSGWLPPDTQGAAGPNHVMVFVNGRVLVHNKSTGAQISSVTLASFFTVTVGATTYPRNGAFDPRCLYDRPSGRWFATGMEFGSPSQTNNGIVLAVSRTSDPTGAWDKYFLDTGVPTSGTTTFFTDYSTLGVDANGVYIGERIFPSNAGGTNRAKIIVTEKASLIAATPSLSTVFQTDNITDMYATPQPAINLDGSGGGRAWFVSSFNSTNIAFRKLTWSGGTPSLDASSTLRTTVTSGNPPNAPASGSTTNINTGDFRMHQPWIRSNQLWVARTVGVNATGATSASDRAACEWFVIDVTTAAPAISQTGRIYDPATSGARSYFYPTICVSGQGHAALGYSGVAATEFVGVYTSGRLATDAPGATQSILQLKAGEASYTRTDSSGRNRWGDYSLTVVDPNDDQTFWTFQTYAKTGTNNWGVWIHRLLAPAPTASATQVTAIPGQNNVSLPITGTGLFDPGVAFPNRLAASASGTGISNVRIAYISPTQASVTFDVSSTAATGTRDITITNPDGQTVTINNAINVVAAQPVLAFSRVVTNTGSAWRVALTITNTGGAAASNVRILTSRLGTTNPTTALPTTGVSVAAGASTTINLDFPLSAATSGVRVVHRVTGDYTGNTFSSAAGVTPP